jgi:16S rRNA (guanine(966)-N(2))-methyltransferase RsmD
MRVIAGTYRSRKLEAPRGASTRPTSDRLRETLFNILQPRIARSRFADLYAGTGAVGIEALSRGASHVYFSEKSLPAIAALRSNLASLKITGDYTLEDRGTLALLERLPKLLSLDIVYLDPPWESASDYETTLSFLGSPRGLASLAPFAIVIAEHARKNSLALTYGALEQYRLVQQGDAALSFYHVPPPEEEPTDEPDQPRPEPSLLDSPQSADQP